MSLYSSVDLLLAMFGSPQFLPWLQRDPPVPNEGECLMPETVPVIPLRGLLTIPLCSCQEFCDKID
jgi:hypothetical protein